MFIDGRSNIGKDLKEGRRVNGNRVFCFRVWINLSVRSRLFICFNLGIRDILVLKYSFYIDIVL